VEEAERQPQACRLANTVGAANLARAAAAAGAHYTGFSSDQVFGGQLERPYLESDPTRPLNVLGASHAEAEAQVLAPGAAALMVRTAALFSPDDAGNFAAEVARKLGAGRALPAAADCVISPTFTPDLCHAVLDLVIDGETGLWHLTQGEAISWAEFGWALAEALGLDRRLIKAVPAAEMGWRARRPARAPLATERGRRMPPLARAIDRYAAASREGHPLRAPPAVSEGGRVGWVA
jgi:dTDP-4-dehydrorhamnose reductase